MFYKYLQLKHVNQIDIEENRKKNRNNKFLLVKNESHGLVPRIAFCTVGFVRSDGQESSTGL